MTRVAVIHFGKSDDIHDNTERLLSLNQRAAEQGADVIVNPELPTVPLFGLGAPIPCPDHQNPPAKDSAEGKLAQCEARKLATGPCADLVDRLQQEIARRHEVILVLAVFILEDTDSSALFNSALVIAPNGILGRYDKRVLTAEGHYVTPGQTAFAPVDDSLAIGAGVCGDYWRLEPHDVLPSLARAGCRLIAVPAAVDGPTSETLASHSFNAAVVLANSFEHSYAHHRPPQSCIVDAAGGVVCKFDEMHDQVLLATLD